MGVRRGSGEPPHVRFAVVKELCDGPRGPDQQNERTKPILPEEKRQAAMWRTGGAFLPQQRLYFSPEPHGQGALRGIAGDAAGADWLCFAKSESGGAGAGSASFGCAALRRSAVSRGDITSL